MTNRAMVTLLSVAALALTGCTSSTDAPDAKPETTPTTSTSVTSPTANALTIERSTFEVVYRLDGIVRESSAVGLDVPTGTVLKPAIQSGEKVTKGTSLGSLSLPSGAGTQMGGTVAESQKRLSASRLAPLVSPTAGVARVTPTSARVESPGLDAIIALKPLQELRYRALGFAGAATVETVLGQRKSACVAIWLEALPPAADGSESPATSAVHCRLAPDLETAAGLPAVLTLTSTRQAGVIAVPLVYIGLDKAGQNYVARVREGQKLVERPVIVGSTDGVRRVITEGLKPGDEITPISSS